MQSFVMRPIFSGGFGKKNRGHHIAWWLNRREVQNEDITMLSMNGILMEQNKITAILPQVPVLKSPPVNVSSTLQLQNVQGFGTVATVEKPVAIDTTQAGAPLTSPVNMQVKNTTA